MKKTLPLIVLLITLSLVGLIVLQVSWLHNLLVLRRAQLHNKINEASVGVAVDLFKGMATTPSFKLQRKMGLTRFGNDFSLLLNPPTIGEKYKLEDVRHKLNAAFTKEQLHPFPFEFAIINNSEDIEMQTDKFEKAYMDTIHNKRLFVGIGPDNAAELEGIKPPEHLIIIIPDFTKQVWGSLFWVIMGAGCFMLIIVSAFFVTLRTLFNQKKLSEIKSDFINNMTHEFKTPLATISLAVDALKNEKVLSDKEKIAYFTGIIKEENKRMNKHVETILKAALQEKQELELKLAEIHVHTILQQVTDNYTLQLQGKNGIVHMHLNAENDVIIADQLHISNLFSNLIDNAIKYCKGDVVIDITTELKPNSIIVSIADNGIGMNKETTKRIFEKFYRAHTGNVHDVKGFGLGMSYVKMVIDAHKGKIQVESTQGVGTTFKVELQK